MGFSQQPVRRLAHNLATHAVAEKIYRQITAVLEAKGIECIVLKGPHLAAVAYEKSWERGYNDLDVLVRAGQFQKAISALLAAGFSLRAPPAGRKATIAAAYDRNLLAPDGSVVEIHRAFSPYGLYPLDYDALFERAESFMFGITPARGLASEDLLVHLVIHAAKSQFNLIEEKHIRDVAAVVNQLPIDWSIFEQRAGQAGCRRAAWVLLSAGAKSRHAEIPEFVLESLRPGPIRCWWIDRWLDRACFPLIRRGAIPKPLRRILLAPALADRLGQIIRAATWFGLVRVRDFLDFGGDLSRRR